MICEACHQREAKYHVTHVDEGVVQNMHLCDECAAAKGVKFPTTMSLNDILLGSQDGEREIRSDDDVACPQCGLRQTDFRKTQRFGCPACYTAFANDLRPMLEGMHRGTTHVGKVPAGAELASRVNVELAALEKQLSTLIIGEQYEEAARVRDHIRAAKARLHGESTDPDSPHPRVPDA